MKKMKAFIISILCLLLPGCNNNSIDYYENRKNKIDFRSFFNGDIEGWGAIFDYQGRQKRSFYIKLKGSWDNNNGILEEDFEFDNGEKLKRKWILTFSNDQTFIGTASDVVGEAKGIQKGNAIHTNYIFQVPYKNTSINLKMNDWMYLIDENTLLNRTAMKKYGLKVGELVICLKKSDPSINQHRL